MREGEREREGVKEREREREREGEREREREREGDIYIYICYVICQWSRHFNSPHTIITLIFGFHLNITNITYIYYRVTLIHIYNSWKCYNNES